MATTTRTRRLPLSLLHRRLLSTTTAAASPSAILNPSDPTATLTSKEKSRAALSLLRSQSDPSRILSICQAASLSPTSSHLDRSALSLAVNRLSPSPSSVRSLLSPLPSLPHSIVLFGQARLLDDALQAFKSAPSVPALNSLLFASILAKKPDQAATFFNDLPTQFGLVPNLDTYNTLVKAFAESGTTRSFFSLLDTMVKEGVKPNLTTFCNALVGFYKEERFGDVDKVIELMKKHGCNSGALSVLNVRVKGLCKLKRSKEALELFRETTKNGMKGNWVSYDHLIYGFCKEGDLESAKKLYQEMVGKGLPAEGSCYFRFIHYLCKGGDFETAFGVCKEIMGKNWYPDFPTMKSLVNGLIGASKIEEAKEIIEKAKEKFPDNVDKWKEVEETLPQ